MTTRNPRVRFLQNNMLAASGVTLTASGAKTGYPVSNLTDPYRYRMWVPPGTFVITAANQNLYINDGANKTAVIAAGTYTYATLVTAVSSALGAVSTSWSVSYDFSGGTYRFSIWRVSGSGTLRLSQQTSAAWDMLGYVGTTDQAAASTQAGGYADQPRNHTSEFFTVDLGVARSPLAFVLFAAADTVFPVSPTATITLKANSVSDFTSPALTRTLTAENVGICHWLDDLANTSYRYWKLEFADRTNPVGPEGFGLNIGYLGDYVSPTTFNIVNGYNRTLTDPSVVQKSVAGVPYVRKLQKYWSWDSFKVDYVSGADRVALEGLASSLGTSVPFILALDPTVATSASACEMTKYVRFTSPPAAQHVYFNMFSVGFAAEEVV